ncbi:MAG: hypothetical protein U1F57_07025 [bacterium]
MNLQTELHKLTSRFKTLWDRVRQKIAERSKGNQENSQRKSGRYKDQYAGVGVKDVKEYFSDFQKKDDMKPGAEDHELSKVIDDVLDEMPPNPDSGLYGGRRQK